MDDFEDMEPEEVQRPKYPPKPASIGVPVNFDQHRNAFRRKWPEPPKPFVLPVPIPPRVRMAEAPPEKIPDNAKRVARMMEDAGYEVRITYGVSGADRAEPDRGKCGKCGKVTGIKNDGNLRSHGPRKAPCEGTDTEPIQIIPGKPLPPEESIAVRVKRFGAACWIDGAYEMGGYIDWNAKPPRIMVCDWTPFYAKVKEAWQAADGGRSALLLDVEPGK